MKPDMDTPAAYRPIASLISKSEKAMQKLAAGTWQHSRLRKDVRSLQISLALIRPGNVGVGKFTVAELQDAMGSLVSLIAKSEEVQTGISRGTSQYSLLHNRIAALKAALALVKSAQGCDDSPDS